jgi:DNA-binding NarL/FixJ family response regulator
LFYLGARLPARGIMRAMETDGARHPPRILLAEDSTAIARQLRRLLARDFDVVALVRDGWSLLQIARDVLPDAVVTDLRLPGLDGLPAIQALCRERSDLAVVVITVHTEPELMSCARDAGALGYVLKDDAGDDLVPAVHAALAGREFVSASIASRQRRH